MGNLCGKESPSDPFSQPGRTLSSALPPKTTSLAPGPRKVGGPPQTLGGGNLATPSGSSRSAEQEDARRKAATAAEERARVARKTTGKLGSQLQEQKKQTRADTLAAISKDERRMRDADAATDARNYH